ncbi:MAG: alpha/beta fold hydrolase [Clostridia bacterium]|nr:alpha/beta fold hydrolase [Clostridia bacterium]
MRYTSVSHSIKSTDGVHTLNGVIFMPIGTPKATVQIIHGMCEHIELYESFMSFLAENGYAVFAHDQLGHGTTAGNTDELGFIAAGNGSELLVSDSHKFAEEFLLDFKGIKHFVFGHSMGSFIARICEDMYHEMTDGIILAGTSGVQRAAPIGIAVTDIKSRVQGSEHRSQSAQRMFFEYYNHEFRKEKKDYSWLSSDPDVISAHECDKLFNFTYSVSTMNDVVRLCKQCSCDDWFDRYRANCPALIISGEHDPLGNFGKGVLEMYKRLKEIPDSDITFKLYRGARHELLNERCKAEVIGDILRWLESRV